jgi:hypothetical protein
LFCSQVQLSHRLVGRLVFEHGLPEHLRTRHVKSYS